MGIGSVEEFNMFILSKFAKVLTLLSLGLFSTQVLAQNFCNAAGYSGTSVQVNGNKTGTINGIGYEQWADQGNNSTTFYEDGSFKCSFSGTKDFLCRAGKSYDKTQTWQQLGHLYADFSVSINNMSNVGYSYIGIYGWTVQPLVEFYIVDTWGSPYPPNPGDYKGTITVDGATYKLYYHRQIQQPSIEGTTDFDQYFSVRETKRECGTIDITAHFQAWANKMNWTMGKMHEAKVLGEAGGGNTSGKFDFNYAKVYVDNGTTPSSSSSGSNPASSSAVVNPVDVTNIPGTIELENYATSGGDEVTIYGGSIVGEIKPNAWLEYPISVTSAGAYTVELLAARKDTENRTTTVDLSVDGTAVGSITGILTTDWDDYDSFTGETTSLSAGTHTLRVTFTGGYVNVDNLKFTKKSTMSSSSTQQSSSSSQQSSSSSKQSSSSQAPVVVASLPGTLQFEDYQNSGGEFKNNGTSLGSIEGNAWVEYTVDFTSAGAYEFMVHVARQDDQNNKSHLSVSIDGTKVGTVTDILTTGWTDFQDFSTTTTNISAGQHTLRVTFDYGWVDADYMKFTKVSSSSSAQQSSSSKQQSSSSVKPSSSSVQQSSSSEEQPVSSSVEQSSSSEPGSSATLPESSASVVWSSGSAPEQSSASVVYWPDVVDQPSFDATTAIARGVLSVGGNRNFQVFDMQGRFLGKAVVAPGATLEQTLRAIFQKPGIYLVKQGNRLTQVRVTR